MPSKRNRKKSTSKKRRRKSKFDLASYFEYLPTPILELMDRSNDIFVHFSKDSKVFLKEFKKTSQKHRKKAQKILAQMRKNGNILKNIEKMGLPVQDYVLKTTKTVGNSIEKAFDIPTREDFINIQKKLNKIDQVLQKLQDQNQGNGNKMKSRQTQLPLSTQRPRSYPQA